ncbi:MAG: hypothetical protein AAF458_17500 [Pseudomonadota bacterium]
MNSVFLGKAWHWALIVLASGLLWFCGSKRLHVIEFNWFIIAMLLGTGAAIFAIVYLHRSGDQITREPLVHHAFDPDEASGPAKE